MSEFKNRLAVTATEKYALQMGWFFRPQDVSDQGIDAHVEKVEFIERPDKPTEEVGTGRLIALQIKGGPSYFGKPSPNGWWFPFSAKKAKLWLGHALPVMVILVDLDEDVAYWQRIASGTVQSTGKGFKVEVPAAQTMSTADVEWTHIASGLEAQAEARFDYALVQLPPPVREFLQDRQESERLDAALLAFYLAEGRANPRGTAESLLATSPVWIERNGAWAWRVVAAYAAQHEQFDVSAEAFERAARATVEGRGRVLAAAGLNMMQSDRARSEELLDEASAEGDAPFLVAVGRSLLEHPEGDAGPRWVDPILLGDADELRKSSLVQGFLADQARRAGDLEAAVHHSRLMLAADPESTSAMSQCAEILLRCWNSTGGAAEDLADAVEFLTLAINQRREWAGPTTELVVDLAQAYALDGQCDAMLNTCLPRPEGTATPAEATDPRILRYALLAADFLARRELVLELVEKLDESLSDRILKMRVGVLNPSPDEARELWKGELERAVAEDDYRQIGVAGIALANLGVDVRPKLSSYVAQSIVPPSLVDLADALLAAYTDLDSALPALRELARTDIIAAEHLIMKLSSADRHLDAADACKVLYAAGGNPMFLVQRAQCLIDADDDDAESVATAAVNATASHPIERGRLFTFLGARAGERGEWEVAERHLTEVLKLFAAPGASEVWRVVISQLNQGKVSLAAKTVTKYRPVVRTKGEAEIWLHANSTVRWDEAKASEALTLARRFNDPQLSTALLTYIITATYGQGETPGEDEMDVDRALEERRRLAQAVVPAELHREAFAVMQQLVTEFGDATGMKVLHGEPDDLVSQMTNVLQDSSKAEAHFEDLIKAVRNATLPLGFLAGLRGNGYATILVQRALGVLIAASADDNEHAMEVQSARDAIGKSVVVDSAALLTLSGLAFSAHLNGQFVSLLVPVTSMLDVHRAAFDIRGLAGSPGSVRWDATRSSIVFDALTGDEYTRQLRRAQALEDFAQTLPARVVDEVNLLADLQGPGHSPWVHPIQLAHNEGIVLWSDDLGLRRLARSLGVICFGTPALIDALRDRALEVSTSTEADQAAIQSAASDNLLLAEDMIVDLALGEDDVLTLAERDEWVPRAGAAVPSRAAWWAWQRDALRSLLTLYSRIRDSRPEGLPDWQFAAMFGVARAFRPVDAAAKLLAVLALIGYGPTATDAEILDGVRRARRVATELTLPDPAAQLPAAAVELARMVMCRDPEKLVDRILVALDAGDDGGL